MKKLIYIANILFCLAPLTVFAQPQSASQGEKWEQKIKRYERQDSLTRPAPNLVLFVGSSTIENWKTLSDDFPDHLLLNRGVSGTKTIDLYNFRKRLIEPYQPKQIFIYEGDNDIGLGWKTDAIITQFKQLIEAVRESKPQAEIVLISVKLSPNRLKDKLQIEEVNELLKAYLATVPNTRYADVYTPMLTAEGTLIGEYYRADGLHLTPAGYDVWKKVIGEFLY